MENPFGIDNPFLYATKHLAIASHLLQIVLAPLAVFFCVTLFRRHRAVAWLLIGGVFFEPLARVVMRTLRGGPFLAYKSASAGSDGITGVTYHMNFPILYMVAVAGLFMLVRASAKSSGGAPCV